MSYDSPEVTRYIVKQVVSEAKQKDRTRKADAEELVGNLSISGTTIQYLLEIQVREKYR